LILVVVLVATTGGGHSRAALAAWARISSPAPGGVYTRGQLATTSFSCGRPSGGPALASCNDNAGSDTPSGGTGHLDTSTAGKHLYTVAVTTKNGATKTASITYTVVPPLSVSIEAGQASALHGRTAIPLACSGGGPGTACGGRLSLTTAQKRGARFQTVTVASSSFSVPAGTRASIPLSLGDVAQQALGRDAGHQLRVLVTTKLSSGETAARSVTLKRHR
jgi:hypothetical protein